MITWTDIDSEGPLLRAISAARAELGAQRACTDEGTRLSDSAVDLLRATGVFRMALAADLGGSETDPLTQLRAVEMLAEIDAALGWYAMIGSDGGYYAAFLDDVAAKRLYGADPDVITAGFVEPAGSARRCDDGYLVEGRWPFGSASHHSTWLASGCRVDAGDSNDPEHGRWVVTILPTSACEVVEDSWRSLGLRGSGSYDYRADEVFVPVDQVFSFQDGPRSRHPLHRFSLMYRANTVGVALGLARGAIVELREAVLSRRSTGRANESHHLHDAVGRAEAMTVAARTYAYATVADLWRVLGAGEDPSQEQRVRFRLMLAQVNQTCRDAVDLLFTSAGGAAIYQRNPLERRFRDAHTLSAHALAQNRNFETAGKALLGLSVNEPMFS